MANKIPWYVLFNWKAVVGTIAVVGLLAGLGAIFLIPQMIRTAKLEKYKRWSVGKVISVEQKVTTKQGRYGNEVIVDHYVVKFTYSVNGKQFEATNSLDGTNKNTYYLNKIAKSDYEMSILVRYDVEKPSHALIVLEK